MYKLQIFVEDLLKENLQHFIICSYMFLHCLIFGTGILTQGAVSKGGTQVADFGRETYIDLFQTASA